MPKLIIVGHFTTWLASEKLRKRVWTQMDKAGMRGKPGYQNMPKKFQKSWGQNTKSITRSPKKRREQGTHHGIHKETFMQREGRFNEDQVRLIRVRQRSQQRTEITVSWHETQKKTENNKKHILSQKAATSGKINHNKRNHRLKLAVSQDKMAREPRQKTGAAG